VTILVSAFAWAAAGCAPLREEPVPGGPIPAGTPAAIFVFTIVFGQVMFAGQRARVDVEMSAASSELPYPCNLKMAGNASKPTGGGLVY
jgi:hypothetical protein